MPLFCLILALSLPTFAADDTPTPCVVAPGFAAADVSPDSLAIDFALETTSESFQQGAAKAVAVANALKSIAPPTEGVALSVSHDLTFMQQKRWSGSAKQQHKFRLAVDKVPEGESERVLVTIVEAAVSKVPNLTVEGFQARLSDTRTKQVQNSLLKQAVADAGEFAATAAAEAKLSLHSPRSVRIAESGASSRPLALNESFMGGLDIRSRSFSVYDTLQSNIRVSVSVVVQYECKQM